MLKPTDDQTPSLTELLDGTVDDALDQVLGAIPGRVLAYDAATQVADVQPSLQRGRDVDGARVVESMPVLSGVPVVFPGAGAYSIAWPLSRGDVVLLVYSSGSLDRWKHGDGGLVDPLDDRRHHPADVVAIPGLRTIRRPIPAAGRPGGGTNPADAMVIRSAGLIIAGGGEPLVTRSEFLAHGHVPAVGSTSGPVTGGTPPGAALDFPGTSKLRG